ncbi:MAG: hypothetical protein EBT09_10720 [Actinobacteria bacterium]|nr:hypothetical protein [Actinomycetota bacterium]
MINRKHAVPRRLGHETRRDQTRPDEDIHAQALADVRVITAQGWTVDAEAYRRRLAVLRSLAKAGTETSR